MRGFEREHESSCNKTTTPPYFFQNYGKAETNLQPLCCHYARTSGKATAPPVSPCKCHAPPPWQPLGRQRVTSSGKGPAPGAVTLPARTPARPLNRRLPRRNPGDYNTSSSRWLLARQAKQLGCYGNFMVLIKFISSLLIKFGH